MHKTPQSGPETEKQKFWPLFLTTLPLAIIGFVLYLGVYDWSLKGLTFTADSNGSIQDDITFTLKNSTILPIKYAQGCPEQIIEVEAETPAGWVTKAGYAMCSQIRYSQILLPFQSRQFTLNLGRYGFGNGNYRFGKYVQTYLGSNSKYFFRQEFRNFHSDELLTTNVVRLE